METGLSASFIPHDTAQASGLAVRERSAGLPEFALLVSIVLIIASAALAGGVFLYAQYLQTASSSKVQQLERAKAAFDPSLIESLMRLNDRIHAADTILGSHLAPTLFFEALQAATLSTVSFQNLDLQADKSMMTIKMAGVAQSVNSIALQADLFSKNGVIKDPIFSGIDREQDGVHFSLTAEVDPKAIAYRHFLQTMDASQAAGAAFPAAPSGTQGTPAQNTQVQPSPANPIQQAQQGQGASPFGTLPARDGEAGQQ